MLAIFMTTFREGLEALLIISIAMAFLRKTDNAVLLRPLFSGAITAVAGSAALGVYLARTGALSPVWEGVDESLETFSCHAASCESRN